MSSSQQKYFVHAKCIVSFERLTGLLCIGVKQRIAGFAPTEINKTFKF